MRQAEPVQHERNGRERVNQDAALVQGGLEFGQGDVRPAADEAANQSDMGLQDRTAMAADLGRSCAAGQAHTAHQLDGRRGAHLEAFGGLSDG
jgi:hypothetical protein